MITSSINYSFLIWLVHFGCAVILFFLINWIGEHTVKMGYVSMALYVKEETSPLFNFAFKVFAPVVFIILLSTAFQLVGLSTFSKNIYIVVVNYWAIRLLAILLRGYLRLLNWWVQIFYIVISIGVSIAIYYSIDKSNSMLPNPQALIDQLWILIILFLYSVLNNLQIDRKGTIKRKEKHIVSKYEYFSNKYGDLISDKVHSNFMRLAVFSIMIYEDFNRSRFIRSIERLVFHFSNEPHSYGIMQFTSKQKLSDEESIMLGIEKIHNDSLEFFDIHGKQNIAWDDALIRYIAEKYNGGNEDYSNQIHEIYCVLAKKFGDGLHRGVEYTEI